MLSKKFSFFNHFLIAQKSFFGLIEEILAEEVQKVRVLCFLRKISFEIITQNYTNMIHGGTFETLF